MYVSTPYLHILRITFSKYKCGLRKGHSAQHCLFLKIKKWKSFLDQRKLSGAFLTDLSKGLENFIFNEI